MKELSIEQKARRYDEAIERANNLHKDAVEMENNMTTKTCEIIFPELSESEGEGIRKALLEMVHDTTGDSLWVDYNVHKEDAIAWLEKQGDKDKFIEKELGCIKGYRENTIKRLEELEKQGEQKPTDKVEPKFKVGDTITDPTDSTFTFHINAIKDGKYMESDKDWILIKEADSDYELVEQKTIKWSEEDKNHVKSILSTIKCCKAQFPNSQAVVEAYNAGIDWLKHLKERYTWKPSDEQMYALEHFVRSIGERGYASPHDNNTKLLYSLLADLKKLREE